MVKLQFKDLEFEEKPDFIRISFLNIYYFDIKKQDLNKISKFSIGKNYIQFNETEKRAKRKFNQLIDKGLNNLFNKFSLSSFDNDMKFLKSFIFKEIKDLKTSKL